jgi:preprotein translocase subunit YajC
MFVAQGFPRGSLFLLLIPIIFLAITMYFAIWVYRDAEKRGQEPALWLLIILVSNILGLILWLILRPEKTRKDEYSH